MPVEPPGTAGQRPALPFSFASFRWWETGSVMRTQVVLELAEGACSALRSDPVECGRELPLAAAVKWYELGKLSRAKAAELAGLSRYEFVHALTRSEVPVLQETVKETPAGLRRG